MRARVRALPGVALRDRCDVLGLLADGSRVTGVRILRRAPGSAEERLAADLVVAASGRAARVPAWLEQLGWERPDEERLPVDVGYASRFVRLPEGALGDERMLLVTATPEWPRALYVFPQEGGRHIVSVGGYGAAHRPPADPAAFMAFVLSVAPPDLQDVLAGAEPLSDVATHAFPVSVRRRYERLARFPDGLLVCGDAIASFNPTYGQGMSVAAAEAVTLRDCLAAGERGLARRFFTATARGACGDAWDLATGSDLALPQVAGPRPVRVRVLNAYLRRLRAAAVADHAVAGALIAVIGLVEEPRTLLAPRIVRRVARGPRARPAPALPLRRGTLRIGGVTTPLREAGPEDAAEAVVFLHGNPGSGADWEPLLATAGAHGHRAIAWDAPGFGGAEGGFPQTVGDHAAFIGAALDALGVERAHLVLHDFGGPWGLRWAVGDPERFASAVLLNTGALPGYRWHALARVWRARGLGEAFNATTTRAGLPDADATRAADTAPGRVRRPHVRRLRPRDAAGGARALPLGGGCRGVRPSARRAARTARPPGARAVGGRRSVHRRRARRAPAARVPAGGRADPGGRGPLAVRRPSGGGRGGAARAPRRDAGHAGDPRARGGGLAGLGRCRCARVPPARVEAGGIEPPTQPCKGRVFPLAPRPRAWSRVVRRR